MRADDVARYLQDHPQFFDDYHDLLAQLYVPHPHGGRTISITERQILTLREKAKQLEYKMAELIRFGEENDSISAKVHRLSLALIGGEDYATLVGLIRHHLQEDFAVPHVAIRLWNSVLTRCGDEFQPVGENIKMFAGERIQPYCGPINALGVEQWFGEAAPHLRSMALVPLRREAQTVGLLALASEEVERFHPEMGTLYLERIGELVRAALLRELG